MLAALLAVASVASGCGPDYITQLPVLCEQTVEVPFRGAYPVALDADVSVAGRFPNGWKPLPLIGSSTCLDTLRRRALIARVHRCAGGIEVQIGRRSRRAPTLVRIEVAGRSNAAAR